MRRVKTNAHRVEGVYSTASALSWLCIRWPYPPLLNVQYVLYVPRYYGHKEGGIDIPGCSRCP